MQTVEYWTRHGRYELYILDEEDFVKDYLERFQHLQGINLDTGTPVTVKTAAIVTWSIYTE